MAFTPPNLLGLIIMPVTQAHKKTSTRKNKISKKNKIGSKPTSMSSYKATRPRTKEEIRAAGDKFDLEFAEKHNIEFNAPVEILRLATCHVRTRRSIAKQFRQVFKVSRFNSKLISVE